MNAKLFLPLLTMFTSALLPTQLRAQDATAPTPDTPSGPVPASSPTAAAANSPAPIIPVSDFPPSRYETLWKKSPFSVATPDGPADTSPDYVLYGIANIDGITYASLYDNHSQEHFLITSDKPNRGMTVNAISRSPNGGDTFANVMKEGQTLTLKLATAATAPGAGQPPPGMNLPAQPVQPGPGQIVPNIQVPGSGQTGFPGRENGRPFPRIHRPRITLPPAPQIQPAPAPAPPPPPQPPPQQ